MSRSGLSSVWTRRPRSRRAAKVPKPARAYRQAVLASSRPGAATATTGKTSAGNVIYSRRWLQRPFWPKLSAALRQFDTRRTGTQRSRRPRAYRGSRGAMLTPGSHASPASADETKVEEGAEWDSDGRPGAVADLQDTLARVSYHCGPHVDACPEVAAFGLGDEHLSQVGAVVAERLGRATIGRHRELKETDDTERATAHELAAPDGAVAELEVGERAADVAATVDG